MANTLNSTPGNIGVDRTKSQLIFDLNCIITLDFLIDNQSNSFKQFTNLNKKYYNIIEYTCIICNR